MTAFVPWLRSFPWLYERDVPCIISPDLDGVACGLLQAHTWGWRVVGTYDGTHLCLFERPDQVAWESAVFIDMEILRKEVRSIGNHLLALDAQDSQTLAQEFPHCANPNIWRGINLLESFQRKYPFGTLPLLVAAAVDRDPNFEINDAWLGLMLHTDSSFTNAATYQENALEWLEAMAASSGSMGIERLCERLHQLSALQALRLLATVQRWAADAGFGTKQRACRFKPLDARDEEKARRLVERIVHETGVQGVLPLGQHPLYSESFETLTLPLDSKEHQKSSFDTARERRVVSMAATGRNDKGLMVTLPKADSAVSALR